MNALPFTPWSMVFARLVAYPPGTVLKVSKRSVIHPADQGARLSIGLPKGQRADFRWTASDCRGLHVRDFGSHYEAHIDRVDPACDVVEHLRRDSPASYILGASALGGLVGLLLGNNKEALQTGAAIGAVIGVLTSQRPEDDVGVDP